MKSIFKRFFDPPAEWKYVAYIDFQGRVILTDGSVAKLISNADVKIGERVLIYKGCVMKFKSEDVKPVIIFPSAFEDIIICLTGLTTTNSTKKMYNLKGRLLTSTKWNLTDDGKYDMLWDGTPHDDPDLYDYDLLGGGLNIPKVSSGMAAKSVSDKSARFILNSAVEDEMFAGWDYSYGGYEYSNLFSDNSLIFKPYAHSVKPFMSRYTADGIILISQLWKSVTENNTLEYDVFNTSTFIDSFPIVKNIWKYLFNTRVKSSIEIDGDETCEGKGALISAVSYYPSDSRFVQDVVRADNMTSEDYIYFSDGGINYSWTLIKKAEPLNETYHFDAPKDTGDAYQRGTSETYPYLCISGDLITKDTLDPDNGKEYSGDPAILIDTGLRSIKDDVKLLYTQTYDGKQTFVRMQKTQQDYIDAQNPAAWVTLNTGIYCADQLVEESGIENVINLYNTTEEWWHTPIYCRKTRYKILHAHHGARYNAVVYRKTIYLEHGSELLDYRKYAGQYYLIRKNWFKTETTFWIWVNGQKHQIMQDAETPYKCTQYEYTLTTSDQTTSEAYDIVYYMQMHPWSDTDTETNNFNVTRIFTDEAKDFFIGFDVFLCSFRHDLTRALTHDSYYGLFALYDDSEFLFPPTSDGSYSTVADRQWKLFNSAGSLKKDLTPPKDENGSNVNRINGICLLQK